MTLRFVNRLSDIEVYVKRSYKKNTQLIFSKWSIVISIAIGVAQALNKQGFYITILDRRFPDVFFQDNFFFHALYNAALIYFFILLIRYFIIRNETRHYRWLIGLDTEKQVTLTEDSLISIVGGITTEYKYNLIYNCYFYNDYCYILLSDRKPLIIPKDAEGFDEFIKILQQKTTVHINIDKE